MRRLSGVALAGLAIAVTLFAAPPAATAADTPNPPADLKAFQKYFKDKFPKVKFEDFVNGPYSMDEGLYKQWKEKEEFPPYEFALDLGKELMAKPFKNGKTL
ncbi:MAG: sulfur oxidation c-type cytochrome SoxA, partial [Rhizobiales bacterium]|nr:sulfur oxidation c-type cytochrome SoxA [Hyphomicrobiales bacterium]